VLSLCRKDNIALPEHTTGFLFVLSAEEFSSLGGFVFEAGKLHHAFETKGGVE